MTSPPSIDTATAIHVSLRTGLRLLSVSGARSLLLAILMVTALAADAHEVRPGYLQLTEASAGEFDIFWKVPLYRGAPLFIRPTLPPGTEPIVPVVTRTAGDAEVKEWRVATETELRGSAIAIQNLESTLTDVIVRVDFLDGGSETLRLTPGAPEGIVPVVASRLAVVKNYFVLGVEHILLGIDHLLFVFALLLLVRSLRLLIETITAFTIAHSVTLALASLGYVHLPSRPVEAIIALSIVFVASEVIHSRQGRPGLSERYPWAVALIFGLLHGLGFAGALAELGLPEHAIPEALFFFNVGVEAGQLAFVAVVLGVIGVLRRIHHSWPEWSYRIPAYGIGGVAMFWCIERVLG